MSAQRRRWLLGAAAGLLGTANVAIGQPGTRASPPVDHDHRDWSGLLTRHVVLSEGGSASAVNYAAFMNDRPTLRRYLTALSGLSRADFDAISAARQKAFLINAYNAFTIELILTRYPDLRSIKDLGTLFTSPWRRPWIPLFGTTVSLDDIEHGMLRARGRYDDPRIHFAVNCASVGCPMLRETAYVADGLDAQLDQQTERFLRDRARNRWNPAAGRLELSKIFDWYGEDFALGHRGIDTLRGFVARHADLLADTPADRERLRHVEGRRDQGGSGRTGPQASYAITFLDYDWSLNDRR